MAEKEKNKLSPGALIKGIVFSIIITLILILIITCICYFANVSERGLGVMIFAASAISVFLSSLFMARHIKRSGLIFGALNGLGYFIVIFVSSVCASGTFAPSSQGVTMLVGAVLSGALGGVLGINK